MSFRDVEDFLAERGSLHETVRRWVKHFASIVAVGLRKHPKAAHLAV